MFRVEIVGLPAVAFTLEGTNSVTSPTGELVEDREMTPDKPFTPVIVIDELPDDPAGNVKLDGLAFSVKSSTWTVNWSV